MSAVTKRKPFKTGIQPVMRPRRGKVIDIYHPYITRLRALSATAKKLINGPTAYRGAEFTRWHKDTADLYAECKKKGLLPVFEERFLKRRFGRSKDVLTETQIYALFKADMIATVRDFQRILLALQRNKKTSSISLAGATKQWPALTAFFAGTGRWWAVGFATLAFGEAVWIIFF